VLGTITVARVIGINFVESIRSRAVVTEFVKNVKIKVLWRGLRELTGRIDCASREMILLDEAYYDIGS